MCDYDPPAIVEHKTVKARKLHRCSECGEDILIGFDYTKSAVLYDGAWFNAKTCSVRALRSSFSSESFSSSRFSLTVASRR